MLNDALIKKWNFFRQLMWSVKLRMALILEIESYSIRNVTVSHFLFFSYIITYFQKKSDNIVTMASGGLAAPAAAQLMFDDFGNPFIVVRDQEKQKRLTGIDALKVFFTIYYLCNFLFIFFLLVMLLNISLNEF